MNKKIEYKQIIKRKGVINVGERRRKREESGGREKKRKMKRRRWKGKEK